MRRIKLKTSAVLLVATLLLGQVTPGWAAEVSVEEQGGISTYSIFDSDISSLEMQGGYLTTTNTTAGMDKSYLATLGSDEEFFSLTVTPAETEFPPTLELFLDGSETVTETLTPGAPSTPIPVAPGDTRSVVIRATAHKPQQDGTTKVTNYDLQVHRTQIKFQWTLGEPITPTEGVTVLPVTLNAPAGLGMKTLALGLGFDPSKLQLCDKSGQVSQEFYDVLEAVPGFYYSSATRSGYFEDLATTADNTAGRVIAQFGKSQSSSQTAYTVEAEKTGILTVYFQVLDPAFTADTLYILEDGKVTPPAGISVMEVSGRVSQCAGMVEVVGLAEPVITHRVILPKKTYAGGTLTAEPDKIEFTHGEALTLTAAPAEGYTFDGWETGTTGLTGEGETLTLTVEADLDLSTLRPIFGEAVVVPPDPVPILPGDILGGSPTVSEDGTTATQTDDVGNQVSLVAVNVNTLTEGMEITLTATPAAEKRFLYWRVTNSTTGAKRSAIEGDSQQVRDNPLTTTVQTGTTHTAVFGEARPGADPELGVLEPQIEGRRLVSTDGTGNPVFGFQAGVYEYDLYLLAEEPEVAMTVTSDSTVTGITATGADGATVALTPSGEGYSRTWLGKDDSPLALTLAKDKANGTVTITLSNEEGKTRDYIVTLYRIPADPVVTIAGEGETVIAKVDNAHLRALSISLLVPKSAFDGVLDGGEVSEMLGVLPEGLTYAKATVSAIGGDENHWRLNLAVDTGEDGGVYTQPFQFALFTGAIGDVTVEQTNRDNVISDARFGTLYQTTRKDGGVMLSGTVTGHDITNLPQITLKDALGGLIEATVTVSPEGGYGRQSFAFQAELEAGVSYTMTVSKKNHTGWIITEVLLNADVSLKNALVLYAGDLDSDNRVTVFDADILSSGLNKGDLDGDAKATVFDLDVLTAKDNYGGAGGTLSWNTVTEGSELL